MTRTEIKTKIDDYFTAGVEGSCTLAELKEVIKDLVDHQLNVEDDGDLLAGLADYDATRSYDTGQGCFYNGLPRRANKTTTGTFKTADWDMVWESAKGGMLATFTNPYTYSASPNDQLFERINVPANSIIDDGQVIKVKAYGTFASNTNNKTLKFKIGSTDVVSWTTNQNGGRWFFQITLVSSGASFDCFLESSSGYLGIDTSLTQDPKDAYDITAEGQSSSNSDIGFEGVICEKIGKLI